MLFIYLINLTINVPINLSINVFSLFYHQSINKILGLLNYRKNYLLDDNINTYNIFIHGRNAYPSDFYYMMDKLDLPNMIAVDLGKVKSTGKTSVKEDADNLYNELVHLRSKSKVKEINLIGVSKGGLVALEFLRSYGNEFNIKKIITISSPLHGTYTASLLSWYSPLIKELSYKNSYVMNLLSDLSNNSLVNIYNIYSSHDHLIIPSSTAYLPFAKEVYNYEGWRYSHPGIQHCPEVINKVREYLN